MTRNPRPRIGVAPLQSAYGRRILRRNYRWMRSRGVSVDVARMLLDSTMRAATGDDLHVWCEASAASWQTEPAA